MVDAIRMGFEFSGVGVMGVGATAGYIATESVTRPYERNLYKATALGDGPVVLNGFLETAGSGFMLPVTGDSGTFPNSLRSRNFKLQVSFSGIGPNVPAEISIEIGPIAGQSGDYVYSKTVSGVNVHNVGMAELPEIIGRFSPIRFQEYVGGHYTSFVRASAMWNDVMNRG